MEARLQEDGTMPYSKPLLRLLDDEGIRGQPSCRPGAIDGAVKTDTGNLKNLRQRKGK